MANIEDPKAFGEDPLEQLLDEESDEEFGLPEFREHFADSLSPAVLKDWTAKDFASIYVRFRPHLERHARRYLQNPSQVEEVVQDAFLYLMTSLPELDSELGVLKFLKWKTRLLALDVIRANSRATMAPIDDQPEFASNDPEISQELERAEDAAIVSMALARLQPRHREALIATLYEEKPQEVVAAQMGLSENAFRQLLFRARGAFKKALVGEAETAGLSVSQILSIAARRARAESGKLISAAGAFLLVLALSIGFLPSAPNLDVADAPEVSDPSREGLLQPESSPGGDPATMPDWELETPEVDLAALQVAPEPQVRANVEVEVPTTASGEQPQQRPSIISTFLTANSLRSKVDDSELFVNTSKVGDMTVVQLSNLEGFSAYVELDSQRKEVSFVKFSFELGESIVSAVPKTWASSQDLHNGSRTVHLAASDLIFFGETGNASGEVLDSEKLASLIVRLTFEISPTGAVSPIRSTIESKNS